MTQPNSSTRRTGSRRRSSLFSRGEPLVWIAGGALVICLIMISSLLLLVVTRGLATFWPDPLPHFQTFDSRMLMGEETRTEVYAPSPETLEALPDFARREAQEAAAANDGKLRRRLIRTGNYDLTNTHFQWVGDQEIAEETFPEWALVVERLTWGRFYGFPEEFRIDGEVTASEPQDVWKAFQEHHSDARRRRREQKDLEEHDIGRLSARLEAGRLAVRKQELDHGSDSEEALAAQREYERLEAETEAEFRRIGEQIRDLKEENERFVLVLRSAAGAQKSLPLAEIVRAYPANQLTWPRQAAIYAQRWVEFLFDEPREANSEGGVFPAIFGTVVMTLIMSILVVPFGVLAALYLREYARQGALVSIVRIAVNNLAGVPSIVFGVFGLGFFCYIFGASIDQLLFSANLPNPTYGKGGILWASLTLALLTLPVVIVATEEALAAVPNSMREGSYACGASKWQTIQRIVLPRAMPGIMTGMILAIARGAGEVAPLMLVGAVKLAPKLPFDLTAPFIHPERSFMHLGFHIYDLGFQSQNSEAAKPMVFTTTFLLIGIVVLLNIVAVRVRDRLRRNFEMG